MLKEKALPIIVDWATKKQLLTLGSYATIKKSLEGKQDTPQALKIREKAIELGGIEVKSKKTKK